MLFLIVNNSRDIVNMSQLNEYYTAGDSFNATCMISAIQLSPPIATKVTINIVHNNKIINSSVLDIGAIRSNCSFSLNISFTNLKLSQSGVYTCCYNRSNNSFVQPSDVKSANTSMYIKSGFIVSCFCKIIHVFYF